MTHTRNSGQSRFEGGWKGGAMMLMLVLVLMTYMMSDDPPDTPANAGLREGGRVVVCILAPFAAAAAARVGG